MESLRIGTGPIICHEMRRDELTKVNGSLLGVMKTRRPCFCCPFWAPTCSCERGSQWRDVVETVSQLTTSSSDDEKSVRENGWLGLT